MKRITIAILIAAAFLLTGAVSATAQNFQGLNTLQNIASEGQSVGKYAVNIAFVFSGIVGAICLIPAGIKFFKGEQQSKDAITSVGLGLIAIFIILAIIKAAMAFS
jgi:hypothetical protein